MLNLNASGTVIKTATSGAAVEEVLEFVELENSGKRLFQVFSYDSVISEAHLRAAYVNTLLAFGDGSNVAARPHIEMLLFAAMTKQIGDAIRVCGIRSTRRFVAFSDRPEPMRRFGGIAKLARFTSAKEHSMEAARRLGFAGRMPDEHAILARMTESRIGL